MQIGVPLETHAGETRVSATPETVKKLIGQGHQVIVQSGAGVNASQPDSAYEAAGATIGSAAEAFGADLVLKVVAPSAAELAQMKSGAVLVGNGGAGARWGTPVQNGRLPARLMRFRRRRSLAGKALRACSTAWLSHQTMSPTDQAWL